MGYPMGCVGPCDGVAAMAAGKASDRRPVGECHGVIPPEVDLVADREIVDLRSHGFDHSRAHIACAEGIGTARQLPADERKFRPDAYPGIECSNCNLIRSGILQDHVFDGEGLLLIT